jgi:hypothetical protein
VEKEPQDLETCRRCYSRERIPTYQFVKFDLKEQYLCQRCWEDFRRWFHWGQRPLPASSSAQ